MKRYFLKIYRLIVGSGIDLQNQRGGYTNHLSYIKQYGAPLDDISRSKAQQWCQQQLNDSSLKLFFLWPILWPSACFVTILLVGYSLFHLRPWQKKGGGKLSSGLAFVNTSIIPEELSGIINNKPMQDFSGFTARSIFLLLSACYKTSLMPILQLKCLRAIWRSRYGISGCDFVVVSMEYSSASSIFTRFCELNNCRSFNVMHGEKILNSRDSFCRFSRFYVWDKYYQLLLQDLKNTAEFVVALAPMLTVNYARKKREKKQIVYFLQGLETADVLHEIESKLSYIAKNFGCSSIFYKCHPRYSNPDVESFLDSRERFKDSRERFKDSRERFDKDSREQFKDSREQFKGSREQFKSSRERFEGSLNECFSRFDVMCGNYSTVLYQAYISRVQRDDFSIVILEGRAAVERRFIMHQYADYMLID